MMTYPKGNENTPLKPFMSRVPLVRPCKSPMSKEQTPTNPGVTALMVMPLSKRFSPSIPGPGYVLRSAPPIKWIGIQDGNFLRHLQGLGASPGIANWATTGFWWAQPPFFTIPSFTFKLAFWAVLLRSFGQSLMMWSGLPHLKQFQFFLWYSPTVLAKWMIYPIKWSAPLTPLEVSASSSSKDSAPSSPSGFTLEFSSALVLSTIVDQVVKVQLPSASQRETNSLMSATS